jgi:hypothetical protein
MLNKQSMPVWMLNDILGGLLGAGVMIALAAVALLLPHVEAMLNAQEVDSNLKRVRTELRATQAEWTRVQAEHLNAVTYGIRMKGEVDRLAGELATEREKSRRFASEQRHDIQIRRELVRLKGDFARTLFLIDISGSMAQMPRQLNDRSQRANHGPEETPWLHVRSQIDSWLKYLPVGSFRLICFNHELQEFPAAEQLWLSGDRARSEASDYLAGLVPSGYTYTEKALARADYWRPTTIILFTDGAPTDRQGILDPDQQTRILERVSSPNWKVPINVIALNDYFSGGLGPFLQRLASSTDGGFTGM